MNFLKKKDTLASIAFFLILYLPPFGNVRYTTAIFLFWIPSLFSNKEYFRIKRITFFTIIMLALINLTKAIANPSFFRDALIYTFTPLLIVGGFIAGFTVSKYNRKVASNILIGAIIIQSIICIIQIFSPQIGIIFSKIYSSEKYINMFLIWSNPRAVGSFGNGNYLGFFLVLSLFALFRYLKRSNIFLLLFSSIVIISVLTTRSRAAIGLFGLVLMFYFVFIFWNKIRYSKMALIIFPVSLFLLFLFMVFFLTQGPIIFEKISFLLGRGEKNYTSWKEVFTNRFYVWERAEIDLSNASEFLFGRTQETRVTLDNLYLLLMVRFGLIGTIVIVYFLLSLLIFNGLRIEIKSKLFGFALMITFFISGIVADYWFNPFFTPIYMFLFGTIIQKRTNEQEVISE